MRSLYSNASGKRGRSTLLVRTATENGWVEQGLEQEHSVSRIGHGTAHRDHDEALEQELSGGGDPATAVFPNTCG